LISVTAIWEDYEAKDAVPMKAALALPGKGTILDTAR